MLITLLKNCQYLNLPFVTKKNKGLLANFVCYLYLCNKYWIKIPLKISGFLSFFFVETIY